MKPNMTRLAKRTYRTFFKRFGISTPVVVHSLPKCGTTAVSLSVARMGLNVPVYHTHWLNPRSLEKIGKNLSNRPDPSGSMVVYDMGCRVSESFRRSRGKPWNIVTLVRDPVARNISDFFQVIGEFDPDFFDRSRRGELGVEEIRERFFQLSSADRSYWFDREVRDVFDIDVYASPFPKRQGFAIYEGPRARMLLIRLDDLEACGRDAFREFLNIPDFRLSRANVGDEKEYRDVYRRFREEVILPEEYLEQQYASRLARHFYDEEELRRFRSRWSRDAAASA